VTPRFRLLALFMMASPPLVAGIWIPPAVGLGVLANLIIVLLAVIDLMITPSTRHIDIEREVSEVLSIGTRNTVVLRVIFRAKNRSGSELSVTVTDEPPEPCSTENLPLRFTLLPWKAQAATYRLQPRRRGRNRFSSIHLCFVSRMGFWTLMERRPLPFPVKIYPDIRAVHRFDLLAMKNRLEEVGLKLCRLKGRGGEFDRLREYRREDGMRHIDWKATAKYDRLISREYTVERNQNILFLLDTGRSMVNETDGISHLDHGLNAIIILSYIALGQGDNVSVMAFSNRIERYVSPVRGKPAIQKIIRSVYDLEPRMAASDYDLACEELLRRQRKRALVVLITHSFDEHHLITISMYLRALTSPHLLLCVFLRDQALSDLADRIPESDVEAFQIGAAAELLTAQTRKIAELRDAGVLVLEVLPDDLSSELINRYLDLKARHLL